MPAGRPSEYDPAYCERVVALGETGASLAEMAYELGYAINTLRTWEREHPEFLTAMTRARVASQVWWERIGRDNLKAPVFQASMWSRSMAARFPDDWREKSDNTTTVNAGEGFGELLTKTGIVPVFPKAKPDDADA